MLPGGAPEYMEGERTALYPFGFGLSYTQFEYRDLEVDVADEASCCVDVRVKVCHVGSRVGTETVQVKDGRTAVFWRNMLKICCKGGFKSVLWHQLTTHNVNYTEL